MAPVSQALSQSAVSDLTPPPPHPHHIQPLRSGNKFRDETQGTQVFCLTEPPSSLASSWNIAEVNKHGVLGKCPSKHVGRRVPQVSALQTKRDSSQPQVKLRSSPSYLHRLEEQTSGPGKPWLNLPTSKRSLAQKKTKTNKKKIKRNPGPRILPLEEVEARSLESSSPELPGFEKRLAASTPPAQRRSKKKKSNRVHRTPLY